jgi:subtilase family serine protease
MYRPAVRTLLVALSAAGLFLFSRQPAVAQPTPPTLPTLPSVVPVCPGPAPLGVVRCHSLRRTDRGAAPSVTGGPAGYWPADLQAAYQLAPVATDPPSGPIVAIVDAFDDPNAEADLAVYRSQFGLPPCTTDNGCFRKVNQRGLSTPPSPDSGWAQEISLDLDMVSAVCPNCRILLVEADSNSYTNLGTAVNYAASYPGVVAVSNSYGSGEFSSETTYESLYFKHPGVVITVSSGDGGYGVEFPAASQYVTAVGGTSLTRDATTARGWKETVWSGAGSGCSAYIAKPSWQTDTGCSRRTVADVAAVADPNTGVAVYDTYQQSGWLVFGGTSVSAPIIASVYALAGNATTVTYGSYPYSHTSALFDVTSGSNGCRGRRTLTYLCRGVVGYDGPSGLGTPNGTGGF